MMGTLVVKGLILEVKFGDDPLNENHINSQKLCGNYWINVVKSIIAPISSFIWQEMLLSSQIYSNIEEKKKKTCWGENAHALFFCAKYIIAEIFS